MKKQFLIVQTAFLGDVILATAVIEKLHRVYPGASIDAVVRKGNEEILTDHPFLRKLIIWDKRSRKYSDLVRVIKHIRSQHYDVVINLQRFFASGLMTALSGGTQTVGFDKNPLSFLFTRSYPHRIDPLVAEPQHEVSRCLALIEDFTDSSSSSPRIYPSEADRLTIQQYLGKPFITVSPASVWFTKQWPAEHWVELINMMQGFRVFLLGAPSDQTLCRKIEEASNHPSVEILAGKIGLKAAAELMRHARMNFTNDSAPLHLCSAVNAPVTAVFCSTVPEFGFGPLSDLSFIVQTRETLDCRPCGLHGFKACPEGHFRCSHIDIDELCRTVQSA